MEKEKSKSFKLKTSYVTQVENKYVFNVSLIFWHLFIALSTLSIVISIVALLWSLIPASQRDVEKQPYPEPVKVTLSELQLEEAKEATPSSALAQVQTSPAEIQQNVEDTNGKREYDSSLNILRTLIPPSKYSWEGSGYWYYPSGERYWTVYKQERYRQWITTTPGIEDKLENSYRRANASNYPNKKLILDGFISIVKSLPEEKRLDGLQTLMDNVSNNISQNVNVLQSLSKVISKMSNKESIYYLYQLSYFGTRNTRDGYPFIDYTASIIGKFDISQRSGIIEQLIEGYYNYFNENLSMLKESSDLFLPLLAQIKKDDQLKALIQYYGVFRNKNYERDNVIAQIEDIYNSEQMAAQQEYIADQISKSDYRTKSLAGIGGGILLIVLIAVVLVFFSIQRSVRKIEEKILTAGETENKIM